MSGFLLDTNVLSELRKPRCNQSVKDWSDAQDPGDLFISIIVVAEIRFGISKVSDSAFQEELERWLEGDLRPWFAGRILAVDEDAVLRWRLMVERGRKQRHTFSQPDLFIAAQADLRQLTVGTRDIVDFMTAGVPVLNPWEFKTPAT